MSYETLPKNKSLKVQQLPRWRIDGVPSHTGAVGAVAILENRGWIVEEIFDFADNHCVFTAEQVGDLSSMQIHAL